MHMVYPQVLLLLLLIPALMAGFRWGDGRRESALARFASSERRAFDFSRRRWKRICILAATFSLVLALSRPVWKGPAGQPLANTGDVVFVLDVSRSMLSADVLPTRLARAKSIITDLARQLHGERAALVAFAGVPSVLCPLTIDDAFFQSMLERASPDSVARGGTRIGDAIQFSLESVFDGVVRARRQLVIVTDGGDQESLPTIAATALLTRGVRLLVVGVGDAENGALVPTSESDTTPILYRGEPVRTKLDLGVLQAIAKAGAGAYLNAGAGSFHTDAIYQQYIAPASHVRSGGSERSAAPWLVVVAIGLLMIETLLSDRKARAAALAVILIADLSAQTSAELMDMGNKAYRESLLSQALDDFEAATHARPVVPQAYFNLGVLLYKQQLYASASTAFRRAAEASRGTALEKASRLGQTNCAYREAMEQPPLEMRQALRQVLNEYEQLSSISEAQFNAVVVRQRLADLRKPQSASPPTPSANKKALGAHDIVEQGGVPGKTRVQRVDKDW